MSLKVIQDPRATATLTQRFEFVLEWRAEEIYKPGVQFEIRVDRQRTYEHWTFEQINADGADILWRVPPDRDRQKLRPTGQTRPILRGKVNYGTQSKQPINIHLTCIPPYEALTDAKLSVWVAPLVGYQEREPEESDWVEEKGCSCTLKVFPGPVERFCVHARPMADDNSQVRMTLVPYDRYGNPSEFETDVPIQLNWNGEQTTEMVRGTRIIHRPAADTIQRATAVIPMDKLSMNENVMNGSFEGENAAVISNPVWPAGDNQLRPGFGEFHWHSSCSGDGYGEISESFRWCRDECNMDFACSSDHSTGHHPKGPWYPGDGMWEKTVDTTEAFHEPGVFATFFGWENSSPYGHNNYYFTDPNHPTRCGGEAGIVDSAAPPKQLEAIQGQTGVVAIAHHTNALSETRTPRDNLPVWQGYDWPEPQEHLRLLEMFQIRGNQERNNYTDAWRGWHQNNNASFQDALALGHKLGVTGGTDNHSGKPARAVIRWEGQDVRPTWSQILTGAWMESLDRQPVFDAIYARHTWAVWDTRAIVRFTLNDALMGDELDVSPGENLRARIQISAEAPYQSVEIVSEGQTVWCQSFSALDIDEEVDLGKADQSTHYYLRALLRNGGIIYASPVFVTVNQEDK